MNEILVGSASWTDKSLIAAGTFYPESMPLSSLASGMYRLKRIFPHGSQRVTISSSADPLVELSVLLVPADSAIVLQPRSLVGIVQDMDRLMRITRHWRLGSLSAWLTLQLRYIVFHGPAKLTVKLALRQIERITQ
jgi:hypothetical protein